MGVTKQIATATDAAANASDKGDIVIERTFDRRLRELETRMMRWIYGILAALAGAGITLGTQFPS